MSASCLRSLPMPTQLLQMYKCDKCPHVLKQHHVCCLCVTCKLRAKRRASKSGFLHRLRKPLLHRFCIVLNTMFNLRLPFQDNHTKLYKLSQQQSNRFGTDRAALKLPTRAVAKERTFPTKTTFACKSALANHRKSTKASRP